MFKIDIQPITDRVGEKANLVLDAIDSKHGDFHSGESRNGLLPIAAYGCDAVGISAEIEQFGKGCFVLRGNGCPVTSDKVVVGCVLRLPGQCNLIFDDLSIQFKCR